MRNMFEKIKNFLIHWMMFIPGVSLLLVAGSLLLLTGCGPGPTPMSDGEFSAFKECLQRGHEPRLFANGAKRDFTCTPNIGMEPDEKQ